MEQESKALKKSVQDHKDLEIAHSSLEKKMAKDREDLEERLIKSEADKTVALCELESCKKQVPCLLMYIPHSLVPCIPIRVAVRC